MVNPPDDAMSWSDEAPDETDEKAQKAMRWKFLDILRQHYYEYRDKGDKPDDPGWHCCSCGWQGYWCDFQPHVADELLIGVTND